MFDMIGTHPARLVGRFEKDGLTVDTCKVTDSMQPYETAIEHPFYRNGEWVIVEMYDSKEEAKIGHDKWVALMNVDNDKLPYKRRLCGRTD